MEGLFLNLLRGPGRDLSHSHNKKILIAQILENQLGNIFVLMVNRIGISIYLPNVDSKYV